MREMVCVSLYEDGYYEVKDIESCYSTQMCYFVKQKESGECKKGIEYFCQKDKQDLYLKKLADRMLKDVEKEISKVQKKKRRVEKIRKKILDGMKVEE